MLKIVPCGFVVENIGPVPGPVKAPPIVVAADVFTPHHGLTPVEPVPVQQAQPKHHTFWHNIGKVAEIAGEVALKTAFTVVAPGVPK
jgi:hypothetical protein